MKFTGLLIISLLILTSCSPKNNNPEKPSPQVELAATSSLVEFGSFKTTDSSKLMSATIYNETGATINGPATISTSDFVFVAGFNCPSGAKNKASCPTLKLSFNPAGKNPGEYNATLNLGSISVPLHATVESPVVPTPENLAALITSSLGDAVDYGTMLSSGSTIIKTIVLKNGTSQSLNIPVVKTNIGPFLVSYDTCSNKPIAKNGTCQLKISFSPSSLSGSQSGSLSYSGHVISFSASVVTPESVAQSGTPAVIGGISYSSNIQFFVGSTVSSSYQFANGVKNVTLTVKNTGNLASTASTLILTGSSDYSLVSNTCVNKSLIPNSTCSVKVVLSGSSQPTASVTMNNVSLSLSVVAPAGNVQLTVVKSGSGTISDGNSLLCDQGCSSQTVSYPAGSVVNLMAVAGSGATFSEYSGGCTGSSPLCSLTMNSNKTVNVIFYNNLNLAASKNLNLNQDYQIPVSGGVPPYNYSIVSGVGSVSNVGLYSSSVIGSATVQVVDSKNNSKNILITVLDIDGSLDMAYNNSGYSSWSIPGISYFNTIKGVVTNSGAVYVVGSYYDNNTDKTSLFMAKLDASGALDSSFGTQGVINNISEGDYSSLSVVSAPDGILVSGSESGTSPYKGFIKKFSFSGSLDSSFGSGGVLYFDYAEGGRTYVDKIVRSSGGDIFAAVRVQKPFIGTNEVRLAKVSSSGSLLNEVLITGNNFQTVDLSLSPAGKLAFLFMESNYPNYMAHVRRLNVSDLSSDPSFNGGQTADIDCNYNTIGCAMSSIGLLPDGTILVGGYNQSNWPYKAVLVRLLANGSLDLSYGTNGYSYSALGYDDSNGAAIGEIYTTGAKPLFVVGSSGGMGPGIQNPGMIRYNIDNSIDSNFNNGVMKNITISGVSYLSHGNLSIGADGKFYSTDYYYDNTFGQYKIVVSKYNSQVTDGPALSAPSTILFGQQTPILTFGGTEPYSFSIVSGSGSINPTTGVFTAANTTEQVEVKMIDGDGKVATIKFNIIKFSLSMNKTKVYPGGSASISIASGTASAPLSYTFVTNNSGGTASGGTYTAGPTLFGIKDTIRVTDSSGNSNTVSISVVKPLTVTPLTASVGSTKSQSFVASGGSTLDYNYSVSSSIGSTIDSSGLFTAGTNASETPVEEVITLTDSEGNQTSATVRVSRLAGAVVASSSYSLPSQFRVAGWYLSGAPLFQSDGKLIVAHRYFDSGYTMHSQVVRLNPDGTEDSTYGAAINGGHYADVTSLIGGQGITGSTIDSSGRVYVVASSNYIFSVVRLTTSGQVDASFGTNGLLTFYRPSPLLNGCNGNGAMIRTLSNNQLMMGASCGTSSDVYYLVTARINSNGTLDNTYGVNGTSFITDSEVGYPNNGDFEVLPDGSSLASVAYRRSGTYYRAVVKIDSNGNLDSSFNNNTGSIIIPDTGQSTRLTVNKNNSKFYISSYTSSQVLSYNSNGSLDTSFGNNGILNANGNGYGVSALATNNFLYVGFMQGITRADINTGVIDPGFGTASSPSVGFTNLSISPPLAIILLPNGNIRVVTGSLNSMGIYELSNYSN